MDERQIAALLKSDPFIVAEGKRRATVRGAVLGAFDTVGMWLGGHLASAPKRAAVRATERAIADTGVKLTDRAALHEVYDNPILRAYIEDAKESATRAYTKSGDVARWTAAAALQMGSAGSGEFAARQASGQDADPTTVWQRMAGMPVLSAGHTLAGKAMVLPGNVRKAAAPPQPKPTAPEPGPGEAEYRTAVARAFGKQPATLDNGEPPAPPVSTKGPLSRAAEATTTPPKSVLGKTPSPPPDMDKPLADARAKERLGTVEPEAAATPHSVPASDVKSETDAEPASTKTLGDEGTEGAPAPVRETPPETMPSRESETADAAADLDPMPDAAATDEATIEKALQLREASPVQESPPASAPLSEAERLAAIGKRHGQPYMSRVPLRWQAAALARETGEEHEIVPHRVVPNAYTLVPKRRPELSAPADEIIGRDGDGAPFASSHAANLKLERLGLDETHKVVPISALWGWGDGYVAVPKVEPSSVTKALRPYTGTRRIPSGIFPEVSGETPPVPHESSIAVGVTKSKAGLLRTYGDHLKTVLGPARISHPEEFSAILRQANGLGVDVRFEPGRLVYEPALRSGNPGTIILDSDASIGAIRHELRHALDDAAMGHPGFRLMADSDGFWRLEFRGYMEEINLARQIRNFDVAKKIVEEMRARRMEILGR